MTGNPTSLFRMYWPRAWPFQQGIRAEKRSAAYRRQRSRGLKALEGGRAEPAIQSLARAVELRPDLPEAHVSLGRALEQAGKFEAARQAYQQSLTIDAGSVETRTALARLPSPPPGRGDFQVGERLYGGASGKSYEVREIRRGGFGVVYVVCDEEGSRLVLKTFQARFLWSEEDRHRFEREALTCVLLEPHPNVVTSLWIDRIEGFPCLVSEYVPGGDLAALLCKEALGAERALELALQLCDGLGYVHSRLGVVHRDVKPANCLLTEDGVLKVTDFGLARAFGAAKERVLGISGLTSPVATLYTAPAGTLRYMAPEQFELKAVLDTRTDVYAFGIVLYQMLTQDVPRDGRDAHAHITESRPRYGLSESLFSVIVRCVEPDARQRRRDFAEVRDELAGVYQALTGRGAPRPMQPSSLGPTEWANRGLALSQLGRPHEALRCFDRGLALDSQVSVLWRRRGATLRVLGRYEDALACCDHGLRLAPRDKLLWRNKGLVLALLKRHEEAIACYERGLEIDPGDAVLWKNKASALALVGRLEEALACCERGLELAPRDSGLWRNKGAALGRLRRDREALVCYERGLEITPRDSGLWLGAGRTLARLGRDEEALAYFERGLEIDPGEVGLWSSKGVVLRRLQRHEEAAACFDRAKAGKQYDEPRMEEV